MQNEDLTPAEHELESTLVRLRPTGISIDRDRLMFRAGQASIRRTSRAWQATTALLAVSLTASVLVRPAPRELERVVYVTAAAPPLRQPALTGLDFLRQDQDRRPIQGDYLRLRTDVLERGLVALPTPRGSSSHAVRPPGPRLESPRGLSDTMEGPYFLGIKSLQDQGERL